MRQEEGVIFKIVSQQQATLSKENLIREEKERDESEQSGDALRARLSSLEAEKAAAERQLGESRETERDALERLSLATEERARLEEELAGAQEVSAAELRSARDSLRTAEAERVALAEINAAMEEKVKEVHRREEQMIHQGCCSVLP